MSVLGYRSGAAVLPLPVPQPAMAWDKAHSQDNPFDEAERSLEFQRTLT